MNTAIVAQSFIGKSLWRGLPPVDVAQRRGPTGHDAALEALDRADDQLRGGPGQVLPAHRESLHEGKARSRSS